MRRGLGIVGAVLVTACIAAMMAATSCGVREHAAAAADIGIHDAPTVPHLKLRFKLTTTAQAARITFGSVANLLTAREFDGVGDLKKRRVSLNQLTAGSKVSGSSVTLSADYAARPQIADSPLGCVFEQAGVGISTLRVCSVAGGSPRLLQTVSKTSPESTAIQLDLSSLADEELRFRNVPRIEHQRMLWAFYRENGALYRATFDAAINSNPDWIFLSTWNEWWEHTYIEPSMKYGDKYLQITREYADEWKAQ